MLIHAHPIASAQLQLKIDVPPGAVLSAIVDVKSTRTAGELFETVADFIVADKPQADDSGTQPARGAGPS